MAKNRRFVVIGLGSFGASVATKLGQNGCRVTAIDANRERVEAVQDDVYEAVIGDATDHEALEALGMGEAEAVVISLGAELSTSLLATLHARELGARRILAKGVSKDHAKILKQLGVQDVIFPKIDVGKALADRLTWPNILDFVPIDPEYSIVELEVGTTFHDKTLREAEIRQRYGIVVLGVKDPRTGKFELLPHPDYRMTSGQLLLVIGRDKELKGVRELG
jgi:trk system potassium uptake protein TrkA